MDKTILNAKNSFFLELVIGRSWGLYRRSWKWRSGRRKISTGRSWTRNFSRITWELCSSLRNITGFGSTGNRGVADVDRANKQHLFLNQFDTAVPDSLVFCSQSASTPLLTSPLSCNSPPSWENSTNIKIWEEQQPAKEGPQQMKSVVVFIGSQ